LVIITYQNSKKRVSRLNSYHPSENTEDNLEGAHSIENHFFLRVDSIDQRDLDRTSFRWKDGFRRIHLG
jgi:hypothetical protein